MKKLIENGRKLCALSRPLDSIFLVLRVLDTTVSLSFFLSQIRGKWMWEVPWGREWVIWKSPEMKLNIIHKSGGSLCNFIWLAESCSMNKSLVKSGML